MSKVKNQIDIAVIPGVQELSDRAAAKRSGGCIVEMLSDSAKVLDSKDITAKDDLDFYNNGEFIIEYLNTNGRVLGYQIERTS